jgi:hypothetical protein
VCTESGTHSLPQSKSGDIVRSPTISSNTVASREVGICNQVDLVCCRPKRSFQFFDPTRSKFRKLKKLSELDTNLSPFGLHRLRFASSRKVEIHWSMRAVTMINLRFVSGSGDRDRCEFREWLCCNGCIGRLQFEIFASRSGVSSGQKPLRVRVGRNSRWVVQPRRVGVAANWSRSCQPRYPSTIRQLVRKGAWQVFWTAFPR